MAAIESLKSKLTLPNLGLLKGAMSDNDMKFITSASTTLSTDQSDAQFEKNMVKYYNIYAKAL